ncbi:hypothetical protein WICANDRAFT_62388 [Wickerhamomyces anomalus NRRL Y-366-8]|uniref:Mating factor alpha n=1 Tax=Wickerhamomyces anomalus (strain ATCC 58044 / CBS 1984 / NCYC 433 / NRRL Y-366-8) TaxID=683960 RepID=A0A1E3P4J2_WICAA|nr:uncharacterized protein WICANDRAFT_62388 [Wickerhamomyces anomalus NRRL Y-366-8]ODQ59802.1 hypothetical protein WICANDRAFT_62388 [Wickerhamomyces anomalus NRRL Y-366-8]
MKFSTAFVYAFVLALANNVFAEETPANQEEEQVGTSKGVEFPFSDDAIIEAVNLGSDIAPIVLDDAVYFINTTIAESELSKLSKRDAEAWQWRVWRNGQPMYKREAEPEAEANPWQWRVWRNGQPMYKREAGPEAEANPWQWRVWRNGQPMYKREAEPEADAWHWRTWRNDIYVCVAISF